MILQIIIAIVFAQGFGYLWYGPMFGHAYKKVVGVNLDHVKNHPDAKNRMPWLIAANVLITIVSVLAIHWIIVLSGTGTVSGGIAIAFVACIGFVLPISVSSAIWSGKPKDLAWKLFFISFGYFLIAFIGYGIILGI